MAQYKIGTVTVTNASVEITGLGTLWVTAGLSAGDFFKIDDRSPVYQISAIESETHLHLTAVYSEASGDGLSYCIVTDFTAITNYPMIFEGDMDWPDIYNKFLTLLSGHLLQTILTTQGDLPYASAANILARLPKGTARQVLAQNVALTAPEWVASLQSILTTQDDIIYASAANMPANLNIAEQRLVGRITGGHIAGLTESQIRTLLALSTTDGPTFDHLHLTSGQIGFPAVQVASADANTLDDYEEGTWTPIVDPTGTATYTTQTGTYVKVGKLVHIRATLSINLIGTGNTTTLGGLPFTCGAITPIDVGFWSSLAVSTIAIGGYIVPASTGINFTGQVGSDVSCDNAIAIFGNSARIDISGTYTI